MPSPDDGYVPTRSGGFRRKTPSGRWRYLCAHKKSAEHCRTCTPVRKKCSHGRLKFQCPDCGNKPVKCSHGIQRANCRECGGIRRKARVPDRHCKHGPVVYDCRTCCPHLFCAHDKRRMRCATCRTPTTRKRQRQQPEAAAESDCESEYESSDDELTQEELDELDAQDGRGHLRPNQVSVWSKVPVPVVALAHRGRERHTPTDLSFARVSHGCVSGPSRVDGPCVCLI